MIDVKNVGADHCRVTPPENGSSSPLQQIQFFRHLFAYTQAVSQIAPCASVLEIGAGEGYGTNFLADKTPNIVATDLSWQSMRHLVATYPRLTHYCQALGTGLPFASDIFDAVISFQVIEHIEDAVGYLYEIQRVVKPGGHFILTTPNRKMRLLPFQKPWNGYHVREYSGAELYDLLLRVFDIVQMQGVMARPDLLALEKARVKQHPLVVYGRILKHYLKKIMPERMLQLSGKALINSLSCHNKKEGYSAEYPLVIGLSDFYLTTNYDRGMDLYGIATKNSLKI
jgi:SAM-dependent methyltransferase